MSLAKARHRQEAEGDQPTGADKSLTCRVSGCGNRWTVDVLHGRVCSFHDQQFTGRGTKPQGLPLPTPMAAKSLAEALPHWQDGRDGA